ncbi:TetR/AcrR family transcriptional regulator [Pseudonocardia lacus]|uniref:TetR/AcrR family transcriptional regulator n=1 Tax=Pseudonocardia lacus TaxID=2835865 RepID=UPI001BDBEF1F|nr:TetR/AcrR family transcriptional regulator [Pseudonocardia lacus]
MSSARPYHHGNLRQAVLDRAAVMLRDKGAAELSLRALAGEIGVTHAAPRRYFPDRQALLDALAVEGFARLGARLREAVAAAPQYRHQVRAVAGAYVDFTVSDANLVELMFAHKRGAEGPTVAHSAAAAFAPMLEMFRRGQAEGLLPSDDPERTGLIFLATLQGVANLVNCGVIPVDQLEELIDDAVLQVLRTTQAST